MATTMKKLDAACLSKSAIPKIKNKIDPCLELFGYKQKEERKKVVKYRNMLFNTLTEAKKKI